MIRDSLPLSVISWNIQFQEGVKAATRELASQIPTRSLKLLYLQTIEMTCFSLRTPGWTCIPRRHVLLGSGLNHWYVLFTVNITDITDVSTICKLLFYGRWNVLDASNCAFLLLEELKLWILGNEWSRFSAVKNYLRFRCCLSNHNYGFRQTRLYSTVQTIRLYWLACRSIWTTCFTVSWHFCLYNIDISLDAIFSLKWYDRVV